jgi:hypothetical protein
MIASVPASAPGVPPDTGASSQAMPHSAASSAAISRVAVGSRLEKSISNWPLRPPWATPCSPNTTSRTTAVSARHSSTMSLSAQFGRAASQARAGGDQRSALVRAAVPHRQRVARRQQTAAHGQAHQANAGESKRR